jgi:succinoglycan biosynthesis protein ExoO
MSPVVSVVMANFNGAAHLSDAIASVLGQSLRDLELIAVDDASTDRSWSIISDAAGADRRVRGIALPKNLGPAGARNVALQAASGAWIAIFDADDLMLPNRLADIVARAEADHADIVADNLAVFSGAGPERLFLRPGSSANGRWVSIQEWILAGRMYGASPKLGYLKPVIRRDAFPGSQLRYLESLRIGEDFDLILRLLALGGRMRLYPEAWYRYRRHAGSTSEVLRASHLAALLAADEAFRRERREVDADVLRHLDRRRRSLTDAVAYDQVLQALRGRRIGPAVRTALEHPTIWPLLTMPILARMRRTAARLGWPRSGLA